MPVDVKGTNSVISNFSVLKLHEGNLFKMRSQIFQFNFLSRASASEFTFLTTLPATSQLQALQWTNWRDSALKMFSNKESFICGPYTYSHTLSLEPDAQKKLSISPNGSSSYKVGGLCEHFSPHNELSVFS